MRGEGMVLTGLWCNQIVYSRLGWMIYWKYCNYLFFFFFGNSTIQFGVLSITLPVYVLVSV